MALAARKHSSEFRSAKRPANAKGRFRTGIAREVAAATQEPCPPSRECTPEQRWVDARGEMHPG